RMSQAKKKEADITWQHCESIPPNRLQVKCKYCSHACWGEIARMKPHLAGTKINVSPCTSVPDDVKEMFVKPLKSKDKKKKRRIALIKAVDNIHKSLDKYKSEWEKWGCTLMCDGWTDGKGRSLTNFLVNSPSGSVFMKSIDTSNVIKDDKKCLSCWTTLWKKLGRRM
ncbi:hypothetical protein CR513_25576, partial [Mucuna pruriens]